MLRVALLTHAAGLGGGDYMALGLTKHCTNVEWTGAFMHLPVKSNDQARRALNWAGPCKLYQARRKKSKYPEFKGINYLDDFYGNLVRVCNSSDLVISFLHKPTHEDDPIFSCINTPIVNYVQGNDEYVKEICEEICPEVEGNVLINEASLNCLPPENRDDAVVIPSAVDLARCFPKINPEELRSLWGIDKHNKVLLYLSRFERGKNPEGIIQTLLNLPDEWICLAQGYGSYEKSFIYSASKYVPNRIIKIDDPWLHAGNVFSISNVLLLPTDAEGDPIIVKEAAISGLPVVTTQLPYMRSYQQQFGDIAVTIPSRATGEVMAQAVLHADSPEYRTQTLPNITSFMINNFNWARVSQIWEDYMTAFVYNHSQRLRFPRAERLMGERPTSITPQRVSEAPESILGVPLEDVEFPEDDVEKPAIEASERQGIRA